MKVGELKIGDRVEIKMKHWVLSQLAKVIGKEDQHDQLHGEFMHHATRFRKIKANGKESHMYVLADDTKPELLRVIS